MVKEKQEQLEKNMFVNYLGRKVKIVELCENKREVWVSSDNTAPFKAVVQYCKPFN